MELVDIFRKLRSFMGRVNANIVKPPAWSKTNLVFGIE